MDGITREGAQLGKYPLGLSKRIAKQNRGYAALAVRPPPAVYFLDDLGCIGPTVNRESKGRLADEDIAFDRLERGAGRVRLALVIARHHPDAAFVLDSYLGRPENMSRGMQ